MKHNSRLTGVKAVAKPSARLAMRSGMANSQ
jgi:hypothetical protein